MWRCSFWGCITLNQRRPEVTEDLKALMRRSGPISSNLVYVSTRLKENPATETLEQLARV